MREFATATHPERQPQASGRMGRALVSRSYRKLEAADSIGDFLTIFADAVRAHHRTWEKYCVLHRNISTSSIMWYRDGGQVLGVLCDFDTDASATANELHHNADVRPFMAMDLLRREEGDKAVPHLYRHELEAFFYVFEYVCAVWNPNKKKFDHLYEWERGSLADIAVQKARFLMEPEIHGKIFGKAHPALAALVTSPSRHLLFYSHYRVFEHQHQLHIGIRHLRELGGAVCVDRSMLETGIFGACFTVPEMTYENFMYILGAP
ncbi:hypothetical protein DAEQUDRAFT_756013 [Daedalea quercina L-15889]|uniref:Fungal-type protein kinase domain-containing protein n=1 Tax=Daedalea quercina L-15889 TaxID=1314783 RepID=A0A165RLM5_9APHY|nr:hypothetical protein DAEQUDRAFT_756013 [Daedalea quercina L-15889]